MRILVSGGGTAGHISPALATITALRELNPQLEILYIGQRSGMEERITQAAGLKFTAITSGKMRRQHGIGWWGILSRPRDLFLNARDMGRVARGTWQSRRIIRNFDPNVIFLNGGYVCLPVGLAAWQLRVPYVIHESDLEPGLTSRLLAPHAASVAVGFPIDNYQDWLKKGLSVAFTGSPVRAEVLSGHRLAGVMHFSLKPELPVILFTGGSGGAANLNTAVISALPELVKHYQVIHLAGERDIDRVRFELRHQSNDEKKHYRLLPFLLHDMGLALAAADIVIARAGANTIAELAALGKPTILVPNTQMAGHQQANARLLGRASAARVIPDDRLTGPRLVSEITKVLDDPDEQSSLSQHIRKFSQPKAASELAQLILSRALPDLEKDGAEGAGSK